MTFFRFLPQPARANTPQPALPDLGTVDAWADTACTFPDVPQPDVSDSDWAAFVEALQ